MSLVTRGVRRVVRGLKQGPQVLFRAGASAQTQSADATDHQADAQKYNARTGLNDTDPPFLPIYERCREFSMTSGERMFALYKAIEYLHRAGIPGDFVECGVWRGGSMMVAASTLLMLGDRERDLHLFDTYEGLPMPDEHLDNDIWGNRGIDGWMANQVNGKSNWALATLDEVRTNMRRTGYPMDRVHFIQGMVEETVPAQAPKRIALLRLDTDWYASTRHELIHLLPRLSANGVLIIDDYGHFKGARKAVDEYIAEHDLPILLNRIDYSGRMAIKTW